VATLRENGCPALALLKCTSAYPAPASEMNLRTIPHLAQAFGLPVELSDPTLDIAAPVAAVALGACIIENTSRYPNPNPDRTAYFPWNRMNSRPWSRPCVRPSRPLGGYPMH
jgi:pseudaminic acid synthase